VDGISQHPSRKRERICEMKIIKCCVLIVVCLCLASLYAQTYNSVRMAYINPKIDSKIPTQFYDRARADGFNYVLAEFILSSSDWTGNGRYNWSRVGTGLHKQLSTEFIAADSFGLRLIPLFQTSNPHSRHWRAANPHIEWQELPISINDSIRTEIRHRVPTFAPDSQFDTSFNDLLNVIYSAFECAHKDKPTFSYKNLDYIHFGADEASFQFIYNDSTLDMLMVGLCQNDKNWLSKTGLSSHSVPTRVLGLMAENIRRKTRMIKDAGKRHYWYNESTKHNTTALYYGDMLDPNSNGGANPHLCTFASLSNPKPTEITKIKTHSLADSVKAMNDSAIVVQWWYEKNYGVNDYDTDGTFRYFAGKGLTFLHGNALADENSPITPSRWHQFTEQTVVGADPKFNNRLIGFVSFHWCSDQNFYNNNNDWNGQAQSYKTMEFLSHLLWYNAALLE
jgi:hypothetical protein